MSNSAQIVLDWLNNDLSLSPKITDIKESFSNGYLFGKVFHILKLISDKEFSEFIDSEKKSDISLNFDLVEKYCKKLFNLIIFEKDINNIKHQHSSAAGVLLYKIRNGVYKLKIHFNSIEFFGSDFSKDEIAEQIKDIIEKQLGDDIKENEKSGMSDNLLMKNNDNIKEELEDKIDDINANKNKSKPKTFLKRIDLNIEEKGFRVSKILPAISTTRGLNSIEFKKSNYNMTNNKLLLKGKNLLETKIRFDLGKKSNSTENIFAKNPTRNLINSSSNANLLGKMGQSDMSTFYNGKYFTVRNLDSQLIDVNYFNRKLEELGITKIDFKLRESKIKSNTIDNSYNSNINQKNNNEPNNYENRFKSYNTNNLLKMKSVEEISNELRNKICPKKLELKNETKEMNVNFMKIDKNFFNKKPIMKLYFKDHSSDTNIRRMNYSKELSKINEQKINEKRILNNLNTLPDVLTKMNKFTNNTTKNISALKLMKMDPIKEFDAKEYFLELSIQNYSSFKLKCEKKYEKKRKISKRIKEIILYIIDMTMEGYFYQNKHKSEIMDLETFLKFNIYFLKNKRLRKKYIPVEEVNYKRSGKIDQKSIIDNLYDSPFSNEDKNNVDDYIYYIGVWNDDKIYDNQLRGIKLDYKYITSDNKENNGNNFKNNNYFGMIEYEPTALESEDLTLPNSVPDNYNLGELLFEILTNYFKNNDNVNNNIRNNQNIPENNDISPNLNGKWDYIPYKISLIGYPLSGRKTIAKKLASIYPNLKIYSMQRIINYYYNFYLQLTDPTKKPELQQDKKGKQDDLSKEKEKVVQIDKEKESIFDKFERQQKLKEMKVIFDALQPYIDYRLNNSSINDSKENKAKKKKKDIKDFFILPDESLCLLLVKKIEEDFPILTSKKINKNILDKQKNIKDMENQIELIKKKKLEAKKPNPKDDIQIEKLENEIKSLKIKSVSGFILVDYPTNVNQCYLLENYLTGFIEEKRRKKSEKDKIIFNTNSIVDYKYQPKEKKMDKKSGLNFVVHISTKESVVNERFDTAKYDPIEKVLYTGQGIVIEDKSVKERLVNKIPYLSRKLFEYYKDEYNNNINKIIHLYSQFGSLSSRKNDEFTFFEQKKPEKMQKLLYHIESENIKDFGNLVKKTKVKKNEKEEKIVEELKNENIIQDKVFNFIHINLIEKLHKENEKYEEELYQTEIQKNTKKNNERKTIVFESDLNIDEIKTKYKSRSPKKLSGNLKLIDNDKIKIDIIVKNLSLINTKYYKNVEIFMHLMNSQKKEIYDRLNLIQNKFRDFLNVKNPKKRIIISNYVKKCNGFYNVNPELLKHDLVVSQLSSDIEDIRAEIWSLISTKQNESIEELNQIKYCSYTEVELIKFYNNVKNLILNEAEKFLVMFNNMILFYIKSKDKDNLINEYNKKLETSLENITKNTKEFKYHLNKKGDVKLDIDLEEVIKIINENIEIIFKNSIKMLFTYHTQLLNIFRRVKKSIFANASVMKKSFRIRKKKRVNSGKKLLSVSMTNDLLISKDKDTGLSNEKKVKKMFLDEKDKFKFRLCFIKNFALKYVYIIKSTIENVFENLDDWIAKNVTLQSESLSYLIKILKFSLYHEKKLIDQESDIDYIELDEFEKIIEDGEDNKILNKNKFNISSNISRIRTNGNVNGSGMVATISNDIKLKQFENSSMINSRIYNKINLNFLIKDNFLETKIEEIYENENGKKKTKPKIKITPPTPIYDSINKENNFANNSSSEIKGEESIINTKTFKGQSNILNDAEFYFDLEKYKQLYKNIKKYEVEDGYINKDIFFEIFIRKYLISKRNLNMKKRKNSEDSEESENDNNWNFNINYFYNEGVNIDTKQNLSDNSFSTFQVICKALQKLNMKQIKRIYYFFRIDIKQFNYIKQGKSTDNLKEKEKKEIKKEKDNKKGIKEERSSDTRKTVKIKNARHRANNLKQLTFIKSKDKTENKSTLEESVIKKIDMKNISSIDEEKNELNLEYNVYLNTKEIFTILSLIGVNILTNEEEKKIQKDLENKLIMEKYLTKNDFLEYQFWFEPFFDYYTYDKIDNSKNFTGNKIIKEFLFDLWKNDEHSNHFNFQKFFDVLKISRYITDFTDVNEIKYYDIIFN